MNAKIVVSAFVVAALLLWGGLAVRSGFIGLDADARIGPLLPGRREAHTASPARWQRLVRFDRWQLAPTHPQVTLAAVPGLRAFHRPVLILWADADGNFGRAIAERLAADLPNAQLRWVADAGHLPMLEAPQHSAAALNTFLAEGSAP